MQQAKEIKRKQSSHSEIKKQSSMLAQKSDVSNVDPNKPLEKNEFKGREIGIPEIMTYYNPKWLAYIGMILSIFTGALAPIMGLFFAKILFTYMEFPAE